MCLYGIFFYVLDVQRRRRIERVFKSNRKEEKLGPRGRAWGMRTDSTSSSTSTGEGKRKDQLEKRYLRVGVGVRVAWGRDITTDQWAIAE